jgi:arsenate reductase
MTLILFGIPNCDTVKKARHWLDLAKIDYIFHDFKKSGLAEATLKSWCADVGWQVLLNSAGTTFRKLPDSDKINLTEAKAIHLMLAQPSMIKRPILQGGKKLLVGFKPDIYEKAFA